jgi:hypothetical protein
MFCPKCGGEFPSQVTTCPRCDVETVDRLPGPEPAPDLQLVKVFATGDAGLIGLVKSLLESEGVDYLLRGDGLQDLFGFGRVTSFNYIVGPAEFWVRQADGDRARDLLKDLSG